MEASAEVWLGIQSMLDDFAQVNIGDDIVIAYTPEVRDTAGLVAIACRERGFEAPVVPMFPLIDIGFTERLGKYVPSTRSGGGRLILLMFEGETMSHNQVVKRLLCNYEPDSYTVVRGINSGPEMFSVGLSTKPSELSALNTTLIERCRFAHSLRIEAAGGTDLRCTLNNIKYQYKSSRGVRQAGKFMVIPPGEVATFPETISGRLVADFALNVNMHFAGDVRLHDSPVIVDIEDGNIVHFSCENREMTEFLETSFARRNARRVGELGFGTNPAVRAAVSFNSHLNERVQGIHLGFGQHNQQDEVAGYDCDIHIDLCAKGGLVWFDDNPMPLDLEKLTKSTLPHPPLISGEDVVSDDAEDDCCGLIQ
ncbi:aminopeptidase [Rhizobium sp. BK491]|uniref:aminopeptidase n=1 Tax=Rhizobium sp. BK491 TaxID=2587009 RepID=UPI00161B11AB|nr:aminopeptidase [Rhizobium sp. BK491]MBB3571589.1 hypothetical protein [Rhizobium sp. BK491]